jgi:acetyl-CoA/propionyl-CoA carboxylase, biotin carboxylase, biotin carboxyl carrier protein
MLKKILIANRGEIAVRVIRTAREMGIATVAVYSDADRDALHVRLADEAYALGGLTSGESYLNTEAILDAIERSGADGVHPGYGFFSENTDFARAITERGVAFIGPPPGAIEIMGDKVSSRKACAEAGVSMVPGTMDFLTGPDDVKAFGREFGYPIAIKAAYGGGGRGMKVVKNEEEVETQLASAQREAKSAFGRDEAYMERYLTWPRHIEMQIIGDQHGNVVWLGERDCSAQRRHQKLIEESPAPAFSEELRQAMGASAVQIAKSVGYFNAGTVEFIFQDGAFFFLEMNTRLQVEHPVTEMVTGVDLVEWMIRVASGEPLPMTQDEINASRRGHAIEIRLNAENAGGGKFLPSPGPIKEFVRPDGYGVRVDAGYAPGDTVSQYYDNLIAKLIVWGKDRDTAIARAIRALEETKIVGVHTTIPADLAILRHEDFRNAVHSTKWVEDTLDLSGLVSLKGDETEVPGVEGEVARVRRDLDVEVNGKRFSVKAWVPDIAPTVVGVAGAGVTSAGVNGAKPKRAASGAGTGVGGSGSVTVPMQGTVVKVLVDVGQDVAAGESVIVLEAMKMENNIAAEKAGKVKEIKVKAGDTVGAGDVVVVIE